MAGNGALQPGIGLDEICRWSTAKRQRCGNYAASVRGPSNPLYQGSQRAINDSTNLRGCIVGPDDANVQWITYQQNTDIITPVIYAYGQDRRVPGRAACR